MKQSGASTTFFLKFHKYKDRTEIYNLKNLTCGEREGRRGTEGDREREGQVYRGTKDRLNFRSRLYIYTYIYMIEFSVRLIRPRVIFFTCSTCSKFRIDSRLHSHWRVTESSTLLDSEDIILESHPTLHTLPM